jgi:hypothetical protein
LKATPPRRLAPSAAAAAAAAACGAPQTIVLQQPETPGCLVF